MKKVIVTGANGFVGAAVCKELSKQGIIVIAVVRNQSSETRELKRLNGIRIVYCDLDNIEKLPNVIADRDIDVFYHFAWEGSSGFLRGKEDIQINNIRNTCKAVRACGELKCKRFVFASSIMEYEIVAGMKTSDTLGISTIYSTAKLTGDYMARIISGSVGIEYIGAIISNIYGPGETSPRLINSSIRKMLRGEHCSFSSGEQMYDFIYITDAARAFYSIGERGYSNKSYYIGSLSPRPLKEFLFELRDVVSPNLEIGLGEIPFIGVSLSYDEFDITALREDTGFVPEVSFCDGIVNTMRWIEDNN